MKSQFFMNMNDMILNKNDELKYLILMREEYYKYKLKLYYFRKWKSRALYNHDLIDEDDPFRNSDSEIYQNFKNLNYIQQGGMFESKGSNEINNNNNINNDKNNINNNNYESRIGNNPDLLIFDDEKKNENNNNNQYENGKIFDLTKLTFGGNPNFELNKKNSSLEYNSLNNQKNNDNNLIDIYNSYSSQNQNNNDINLLDKKNSLEQLNSKKSDLIKLEDSIKVLDVQKNINNALYNTNDVLSKLNTYKGKKENDSINKNDIDLEKKNSTYKNNSIDRQKLLMGSKINNENNDKNEQYYKILNSIERLKNNALNGEIANNNENINKNKEYYNNFNSLEKFKNNALNGENVNNNENINKNEEYYNNFNSLEKFKNNALNGENKNNNENSNKNEQYYNNFNSLEKLKNNALNGEIANNNENINKNEQYYNNFNSLEKFKNNALAGDDLNNNRINIDKKYTDNKNNEINTNILLDNKAINKNVDENNENINIINNFDDLLIKTNNEDNKNNKQINSNNNILQNKQFNGRINNNKLDNKISKKLNNNKEEDNINNNSKNKKKFDIKKLYKYPTKENYDEEIKKKYKNSKYITAKYKDYLHTGDKLLNNKKSNDLKKRNKLNDLYKEIQKNIENDENLLRRLELKRDISSQNHHQIKNKSKSKNKRDISADRINNIKNNARNLNSNNNQKKYFRYDNSKNLEENLLKNGFFSGKNKKNEDNEKENNDDEYNDKIREVMKKYQNNEKIIEKKPEKKYDYIKKIKAKEEGMYGREKYLTNNNNDINNFKINENDNDNDIDDGYDELFHPKNNENRFNNNFNNNNNNQLNTSDYSNNNSVYNILNNLDNRNINYGYDDLINGINEPRYTRINKKKINRIPNKKKSVLNYDFIENSRNNNSYILAPMKGVPITNISFRARMKYFSDKKRKNLEKKIKAKKDEEKQIYTFQPKTGENRLNVIKYDYDYINTEHNMNKKRMPDYNRINNLYLDYKNKNAKLNNLTKEYYQKAGISFTPKINDKNREIKEFKNKVGQIPYLHRIDIYNAGKQNLYPDNLIYNKTEIY